MPQAFARSSKILATMRASGGRWLTEPGPPLGEVNQCSYRLRERGTSSILFPEFIEYTQYHNLRRLHNMLTKPTKTSQPAKKTPQDTETYIQSRINDAVEKGYGSTKIWIKQANYDEAVHLFTSAGLGFQQLQKEPNSTQFELTW